MKKDLVTGEELAEDNEHSLRPKFLEEFIGQSHIKSNLSIFIKAAITRKESLDHVLLYGPPGLGKTSLAQIVAKEMQVTLKTTSGPILSKAADLAAILTNLQQNDVLFIDEIHRLNPNIEEILYSAMEDFSLDIIIGEGPAARSVRIDLPSFTLIGATTRLGLISNPLKDRFGIPLRLNFYSAEELSNIVNRAVKLLGVRISKDGATEIAKRSRGTPRIALRLLKRVRDFAIVQDKEEIDFRIADNALSRLEVDKVGLDGNDHRYLKFICDHYGGGPVGIDTISAALSEQKDSIEDTIEPYLIQIGLVERTPRGRIVTKNAFKHLNLDKNFSFDDE